ncbi:MAG: heavy metal-associated domain-containing protein [Candidatus Sericytochromatia bacterium]|nr:heavy metal-associated domain-containing protein [Candidatus Sericytochromatia bacterium]
MTTKVLTVSGMTCSGCANRLTKVLTAFQGVTSATVTLDPPLATLEVDPGVTTQALIERIQKAGFGATAGEPG